MEIAGLPLSVIVLLAVFVLIAVRQVGSVKLQIWQVMLCGAVAVLLTGEISPGDSVVSINLDVMFFLFGMFVIGEALSESGYLAHLSYRMFGRAKNVDQLILIILFGFGILSAFLMNDTLAVIGTPMVLCFAKKCGVSPKLLMLTLAIAITTGSVMSPIGNPQNLLIATQGGFANPFVAFFSRLAIPTLLSLLLSYLLLRSLFKEEFKIGTLNHSEEPIRNQQLALLSKISLSLVVVLIALKIVIAFVGIQFDFRLTYIALIAAAPVLLLSRERFVIAKNIDWKTLIFFTSMFVLMAAVWDSGFFQAHISGLDIVAIPVILIISVLLSQLISNVPFVALFIPMLLYAGGGENELVALAAGSTLAGNLLILGAASNVIIIQNAEKKGETLRFLEFARVGVPLTALNILTYWVFLIWL